MENVSKVRLKHLKRLSGAVKGTPVTGAPTGKHENQCKWTAGKQALVVVGSRCLAAYRGNVKFATRSLNANRRDWAVGPGRFLGV